ncbi:MAG: molybdopterin cofactor-binding domain-containing protein [Stellaceae bacterium]
MSPRTAAKCGSGSQVVARAQAAAAKTAGLPLDKVVVHNHLIGDGFGRRLEVDGVIRAVQIAQHVDGPVKVIWTREEDIQHDMYRPYWFDRIFAALDEGMPVAWNHRFAGSSVIARWAPPVFKNGLDPDTTEGAIDLVPGCVNWCMSYPSRFGILARKGRQISVVPAKAGTQSLPPCFRQGQALA